MPKISVIMPTFNRGSVIQQAISSVLNQTFKDFELLVVDDGSTDDTESSLSKITDERVVKVKIDHGGASKARNKGLAMVRGQYIAFLDTDNVYHENFLEIMLEEVVEPYLMGYCSENMFLLSKSTELPKVIARKVRNIEYNPIKLTYINYIDINSVLIKKSLLDEIGNFDENLKTLEDWDLFIRIALKYPFKIVHIDQVLIDYNYFTCDALSTVTNSFTSDQSIKSFFQMKTGEGDRKIIIDKIKKALGES